MNKIFIVAASWNLNGEGTLQLAAFQSEKKANEFSELCEEYQKSEPEEDTSLEWHNNHPAKPFIEDCDLLYDVESFIVSPVLLHDLGLTGIDLITAERTRQVEEKGWTPEHDDQHKDDSLAFAAACYALLHTKQEMVSRPQRKDISCRGETPVWDYVEYNVPKLWPKSWAPVWWVPKSRIFDLTRAGALIAAEIDRLVRRDGFSGCPYCGSDIIYCDRCDASRGVAHCDDCGNEIQGDVYRQILENEKHGNGDMLASFFVNPGINGSLEKTTSGD
ncbi:hypothetical protein [uncultured Desulfuromusa sp.]|uniref:hypothetical protein n=1 Tax=uncultured Desulfuromusa sp. TaxID=219183 RepID=UPI002AA7DF9A|nr:hypothetical protein [uncultured Desulfuromusa sp.]